MGGNSQRIPLIVPIEENIFYSFLQTKAVINTCKVIPSPEMCGVFLDPLENMKLSKALTAGCSVFISGRLRRWQGSRQVAGVQAASVPRWGQGHCIAGRKRLSGKRAARRQEVKASHCSPGFL